MLTYDMNREEVVGELECERIAHQRDREEDSCKYAMLVFDLEEMTEARQRDRERLRAALWDRRRWRGKSILLRKHWFRLGEELTKLRDERDDLRRRLEEVRSVLQAERELKLRTQVASASLERLAAVLREEARERIAEPEQKLDISTVHRISLLPTYPEEPETAEEMTECR